MKIVWIQKGSPFAKSSSTVHSSTSAIIYGDSGWISAWIVFTVFKPKGWYGHPFDSWSSVRNVRNMKSPYYGDPREFNVPKINGWKASLEMFKNRKKRKN